MYFRSLLFTSILIIFSLLPFSPRIAFASCALPVSLAEYKEQADIVVLGKVTNVSNSFATVTVERYFKGRGGRSEIQTTGKESDSAISSVDFSFEKDKKYLLFLKTSQDILKTNACMGNKEVRDTLTSEDISVLGSGYSPNVTTEAKNNFPIKTIAVTLVVGLTILGVVIFSFKKRKQ